MDRETFESEKRKLWRDAAVALCNVNDCKKVETVTAWTEKIVDAYDKKYARTVTRTLPKDSNKSLTDVAILKIVKLAAEVKVSFEILHTDGKITGCRIKDQSRHFHNAIEHNWSAILSEADLLSEPLENLYSVRDKWVSNQDYQPIRLKIDGKILSKSFIQYENFNDGLAIMFDDNL